MYERQGERQSESERCVMRELYVERCMYNKDVCREAYVEKCMQSEDVCQEMMEVQVDASEADDTRS